MDGSLKLVGREQQDWALETTLAEDFVLMRGQSGAACLYEGVGAGAVFSVYVPEPGSQTSVNGHLLEAGQAALLGPRATVQIRSRYPGRFLGLDIPWLAATQLIFRQHGREAQARPDVQILRLPGDFSDAMDLAFSAQDKANHGLPTVSVRARLFAAVASAIAHGNEAHTRQRPASRARIVNQALAHMDLCIRNDQSLTGLCQALNVSQRSLNRAFSETFDMSAQQYTGLARLHAIRRALRHADVDDTVTEVATRFNVWDSGRMASAYRQLFGIYPSEELRQAISRP